MSLFLDTLLNYVGSSIIDSYSMDYSIVYFQDGK